MKATTAALVRSQRATRKMITRTNARIPHKTVKRLRKLETEGRTMRAALADLRLTLSIVQLGPQA